MGKHAEISPNSWGKRWGKGTVYTRFPGRLQEGVNTQGGKYQERGGDSGRFLETKLSASSIRGELEQKSGSRGQKVFF